MEGLVEGVRELVNVDVRALCLCLSLMPACARSRVSVVRAQKKRAGQKEGGLARPAPKQPSGLTAMSHILATMRLNHTETRLASCRKVERRFWTAAIPGLVPTDGQQST